MTQHPAALDRKADRHAQTHLLAFLSLVYSRKWGILSHSYLSLIQPWGFRSDQEGHQAACLGFSMMKTKRLKMFRLSGGMVFARP